MKPDWIPLLHGVSISGLISDDLDRSLGPAGARRLPTPDEQFGGARLAERVQRAPRLLQSGAPARPRRRRGPPLAHRRGRRRRVPHGAPGASLEIQRNPSKSIEIHRNPPFFFTFLRSAETENESFCFKSIVSFDLHLVFHSIFK